MLYEVITYLFLRFLDDFFNPGRMYSSIGNQFVQGQPRHFSPHRIKTRKNYGLRGIINTHCNAWRGLNGSDISPFTTNNSSFDIVRNNFV